MKGLPYEVKTLIQKALKPACAAQPCNLPLAARTDAAGRSLEVDRNRKRRELFDAQDAIDAQRDELIKQIEKQLSQGYSLTPVFVFRWTLV